MNISDVKWVIDTYILESHTLVGNFESVFHKHNMKFHKTKYIPFADSQDYGPWDEEDNVIVLYGTWGWINKCQTPFFPGAYGCTSNMDTQHYCPLLPKEWLLNSDYFVLPFGEILRSKEWIFETFGENLFIRPMSGGKTFAGLPLNIQEFDFEIKSSMQLSSVTSSTYVMIAKANPNITGEYRFVVANGEVVAGSQYRYDGKLDIRRDYPQEAFELAQQMAKHSYQPDLIYTCDVATIKNNSPKIIELNSFSCAGMYACDLDAVIRGVSEVAIQEWKGKL